MARSTPPLEPSRNCWRIERAERATVIVDADAYFRVARQAMRIANHQLMLVGWDFDGRILLVHEQEDEAPARIGKLISWLVKQTRTLDIHVLRWDTGAIVSLFRGTTAITLLRWWRHRRIHLKLDSHHPVAASHHQKIVVVDDCLAFCGGIDMTGGRWDTRAHRDDDRVRVTPGGIPYDPWHDATTALSGPVAKALGELSRLRWRRASGEELPAPPERDACWPDDLDATFEDCEVAISRTIPDMPGDPGVREIEQLYLDLIARAERWIYAESQYFASHRVAKAIARRLDEANGPEIVIVNPVSAAGWLEPLAMDTARARLMEALRRRDRHGRLRIYHPLTRGGQPIYVHAKITIVDGEILRVGSSNFNNRSMRLDSECDVTIDSTRSANRHTRDGIETVAFDLLAEHLGTDVDTVRARLRESGSLIETIEALRSGEERRLVPYEIPDLNAVTAWLADHEVLDPPDADHQFEAIGSRSLLAGVGHARRKPIAPVAIAAGATLGVAAAALAWRGRAGRRPRR
ncbi:phospholipase D-like domain-containing protein [Sphingomonas sp. RS6]